MKDERIRLHAWIHGHVQGVGFRYYTLEKATQLNLTGWVRNTSSGDVEVLAEGEREKLENLLILLKRGPRSAVVTEITLQWEHATGEFENFRLRATV